MEETIGHNVNVSAEDFNVCFLGVPYILAGCELQGYLLSYCSLAYKISCFLLSNCCTFNVNTRFLADNSPRTNDEDSRFIRKR